MKSGNRPRDLNKKLFPDKNKTNNSRTIFPDLEITRAKENKF